MSRYWLTILIYAVVGPPIGLIVVLTMSYDPQLRFPTGQELFGSYFFGLLPALIAGVWLANTATTRFWPVVRIGLIMGIVPAILIAGIQISNSANELTAIGTYAAGTALVFFIPTVVCWLPVGLWTQPD
jgi:hypothetical protein